MRLFIGLVCYFPRLLSYLFFSSFIIHVLLFLRLYYITNQLRVFSSLHVRSFLLFLLPSLLLVLVSFFYFLAFFLTYFPTYSLFLHLYCMLPINQLLVFSPLPVCSFLLVRLPPFFPIFLQVFIILMLLFLRFHCISPTSFSLPPPLSFLATFTLCLF